MRYLFSAYRIKVYSAGLVGIVCLVFSFGSHSMNDEIEEHAKSQHGGRLSSPKEGSHIEHSVPAFSDALQANILDFFNVPDHDALHIRWKHAVNSRERLADALVDKAIGMLECDVILSEDGVPICAHPPQTDSDLTVEALLQSLLENDTPKGLKLDFKLPEAVQATLLILGSSRFRNQLRVPIWLNADVLGGPGGLLTPRIDARSFIRECLTAFRWATLSLGWTTGDGSRPDCAKVFHYTPAMVREMLDVLAEFHVPTAPNAADDEPGLGLQASLHSDIVTDTNSNASTDTDTEANSAASSGRKRTHNDVARQRAGPSGDAVRVTFPVNAVLLTGSLRALYDLVERAPASFSLTVWSPFGDDLQRVPPHVLHDTRTALRQVRAMFDPRVVFYDLDPLLLEAFHDDTDGPGHAHAHAHAHVHRAVAHAGRIGLGEAKAQKLIEES